MQLKLLTRLTVVTTVLFFNAKISLAESIKVPYVSISGFQAPLWLGEKAGAFQEKPTGGSAHLHARGFTDRANAPLR